MGRALSDIAGSLANERFRAGLDESTGLSPRTVKLGMVVGCDPCLLISSHLMCTVRWPYRERRRCSSLAHLFTGWHVTRLVPLYRMPLATDSSPWPPSCPEPCHSCLARARAAVSWGPCSAPPVATRVAPRRVSETHAVVWYSKCAEWVLSLAFKHHFCVLHAA